MGSQDLFRWKRYFLREDKVGVIKEAQRLETLKQVYYEYSSTFKKKWNGEVMSELEKYLVEYE